MKTKDREIVKNKFGGRCAYCGNELEHDWQVDHHMSKMECKMRRIDPDKPDNLFPACWICNHRKRALELEYFRSMLMKLHTHRAFRSNPRAEKGVKTQQYILRFAKQYNINHLQPFSGKFYFETFLKQNNE